MTFTIDVRTDINKIAKYMDKLEKKQLPYATSLTLNRIALTAQETICKAIPRIFNNSNRWWDKHQKIGIKVEFSSKYQLCSSVYTRAHFAYIQEEGGIKKPYSGNNIAVPTNKIPKRQRSSKALRNAQGDKDIFKLGKSIYKRIYGNHLQRLYSLTPQARIRPRFGFKRMAVNVYNKQFDSIFTKSFNYALDTAR